MSASLVGSEMCIRDRRTPSQPFHTSDYAATPRAPTPPRNTTSRFCSNYAVSYTHLTLPTICSV
eukprot:287509-Alexandrium_andersonii.AAC.1